METKEHEFCLRCGRGLKNPQARQIGYGSVCYKKVKVDQISRLFQPVVVKIFDDAVGSEKI